jgi:hypothetical protein
MPEQEKQVDFHQRDSEHGRHLSSLMRARQLLE